MGSGWDGGEPPLKKDKNDSGKDNSVSEGQAALSKEAHSLMSQNFAGTEYPALNAMSARAVYYGVQGRLLPNMEQIRKAMSASGPIGEAAVSRMNALSEKGWKFGAISPADEFIASHSSSPFTRIAKTVLQGGYNDAQSGKIAYNALGSLMNTVVGITDGADKDAAYKYIHELAHGKYADGYRMYEATPAAREQLHALSREGQIAHGQEMIQEEVRAITAQVAANARQQSALRFSSPQLSGLSNYPLEAAVKTDSLGALVKSSWPYEGTKALDAAQANSAASEYMRAKYGEVFKEGVLNPQAEKAIASEISRLPAVAPTGGSVLRDSAVSAETAFSSSRYFNYLSRGGQALGSIALLSTVADVHSQFKVSTGSGVGRLVTVGSDWAGFEAGACAGGWLGKGITQAIVKSNPRLAMVALPIFSMGSGLVASTLMHESISKPLEKQTQKSVDELLR